MATAVLSCSKADIERTPEYGNPMHERSIMITGIVTDKVTGDAIEDITISFNAFIQNDGTDSPVISESVYTDSKGMFTIHTEGSYKPLSCHILAEDKNRKYKSQSQQIIINWNGTSFDKESNTFVINDCNFQL